MSVLLLGFGYSASAFAQAAGDRFGPLNGTVRTAEKAAKLAGGSVTLHVYAGGAPSPGLAAAIAEAGTVIVSAAPGEVGDPFLADLGALLAEAPHLGLVQYLSTLGVYGDHGGAWIDESAPLEPHVQRTERRVAAEAAWQAFGAEHGKAVQIFRLAGIYGPGRNPLVDLAAGRARRIGKPGQVFNRIHVEDIAGALVAGIARPTSGVFNVCDDEPARASDVVAHAAALLGREPPPLVPLAEAGLSPMALSFYAANRRCRNTRLKQALGFSLRYPSYREGLAALLQAGEGFTPPV
jgi:hypothetical protein